MEQILQYEDTFTTAARHVLFEGMIFVPTKPVEVGVIGLMVITVLVVAIMVDQSFKYFEFFYNKIQE
jgi:hypothetical protein